MKEIEFNVLTALIFSPREIKEYGISLFKEQDFITERAKEIFKTIKDFYGKGIWKITPERIFTKEEQEILPVYSIQWSDVEEVKKARELLLSEKAKEEIVEKLSKVNYIDFEQLKNFYLNTLIELEKRGIDSKASEVVRNWIKVYNELQEEKKKKGELDVSEFFLGLPELDKNLLLNRGYLLVIGARPNVGKTQFSIQIALHNILKGYKVMYFSTEMTPQDFLKRLLSIHFNVSISELSNIQNSKKVQDFLELLNERLVLRIGEINLADLKIDVKLNEPDIVIVDYLQMVQVPSQSEYERISLVATTLSNLAKEVKALFIATAQINREIKKLKTPSLELLKGSGQIEQQADVVLLLHRPDIQLKSQGMEVKEEVENILKVIVAKNRHKPFLGAVEFKIDKKTGRILSKMIEEDIVFSDDEEIDIDIFDDNDDGIFDGIEF